MHLQGALKSAKELPAGMRSRRWPSPLVHTPLKHCHVHCRSGLPQKRGSKTRSYRLSLAIPVQLSSIGGHHLGGQHCHVKCRSGLLQERAAKDRSHRLPFAVPDQLSSGGGQYEPLISADRVSLAQLTPLQACIRRLPRLPPFPCAMIFSAYSHTLRLAGERKSSCTSKDSQARRHAAPHMPPATCASTSS